MGTVCTLSHSTSAWADLNFTEAASSLARTAARSSAARAGYAAKATTKVAAHTVTLRRKLLQSKVINHSEGWTAGEPGRMPVAGIQQAFQEGLSMRPDPPGSRLAVDIVSSLPADDGNGVSCNRLESLVQRPAHTPVSSRQVDIDLLERHSNDQTMIAVADHLCRANHTRIVRRLIAVWPEVRGDKDKHQDEGNHHVIVETAPLVCPEKITLQRLLH